MNINIKKTCSINIVISRHNTEILGTSKILKAPPPRDFHVCEGIDGDIIQPTHIRDRFPIKFFTYEDAIDKVFNIVKNDLSYIVDKFVEDPDDIMRINIKQISDSNGYLCKRIVMSLAVTTDNYIIKVDRKDR